MVLGALSGVLGGFLYIFYYGGLRDSEAAIWTGAVVSRAAGGGAGQEGAESPPVRGHRPSRPPSPSLPRCCKMPAVEKSRSYRGRFPVSTDEETAEGSGGLIKVPWPLSWFPASLAPSLHVQQQTSTRDLGPSSFPDTCPEMGRQDIPESVYSTR